MSDYFNLRTKLLWILFSVLMIVFLIEIVIGTHLIITRVEVKAIKANVNVNHGLLEKDSIRTKMVIDRLDTLVKTTKHCHGE